MTRALGVALLLALLIGCPAPEREVQRVQAGPAASAGRLFQRADTVIRCLRNEDFEALSRQIHPDAGLAFAPYARDLPAPPDLRFSRRQVAGFQGEATRHSWGRYDGSGAAIVLSARDYFRQFVYDVDYARYEGPSLLEPGAPTWAEYRGLHSAFPEAKLVRYHFPGTEEVEFIDFKDLILVLEHIDGRWWLAALAHAENTV